jgi:4-amino-4-deoxy-L-arabinose transferase-like glycosyltransferase
VRAEASDAIIDDECIDGSAKSERRGETRIFGALVLAIIVASLGLKLWFDLGPLGTTDSDEAVAGLMARHLLHGQVALFYWGQQYGGALEPILLAPTFRLFGASVFTLRLPSLVLGAMSTVFVWRIALRLYSRRQAIVAVATFALVPLSLVWFSAREMFFYVPTVMLGLLGVLMALRVDEEPWKWRWWAILGVATGIGWWLGPSIVYFALPAAVWLVAKGHWRRWRGVLVAGAALVIGALPWIVHNVRHSFPSFDASNFPHTTSYYERFRFFTTRGMPFLLGLRLPYVGDWIGPAWLATILAVAIIIGLAIGIVWAMRAWSIDGVLAISAPFLYAAFPMNGDLVQGRYLYFLTPIVALLVGRLCVKRWIMVLFAVVAAAFGVAFLAKTSEMQAIMERPDTRPISAALDGLGYRYVYAEYWIAYQMDFESDERITATSLGPVRYQPYDAEVRSNFAVFVFRTDKPWSESEQAFVKSLTARNVGYQTVHAGHYDAVIPAVSVQP